MKKITDVIDSVQGARLSLYKQFKTDDFVELIQPLNDRAFTWNSLKKHGNHFHHFCYSIGSLEKAFEIAASHKLIPILGPVEAVLFNGMKVIFYYTRNKQIIEFLIDSNES
ncbi:MAG: VOC family protein [Segetibacter sp.]